MPESESNLPANQHNESTLPVLGTSALAPAISSSVALEPHEPPFWLSAKYKAPWLATLGAAFGSLIGSGLYGEIFSNGAEKGNFWTFLLWAFVIGSAAYWFFDPMIELVHHWLGEPHHEIPKERRVVTTLAIVAATVVISVLHHSLSQSLEKIGIVGFVLLVVVFAGTAGLTTHSWLQGVKREPKRSAVNGAKHGALAGAIAGFLLASIAIIVKNAPTNHLFTAADAGYLLQGTGLWAGLTLLPGFMGGIALEKEWDQKSPTRGVLYAMIAFSGVIFFLALLLGEMSAALKPAIWLIGFQAISLSLGWALGPFLQRESCDNFFRKPGTVETVLPDLRRPGTVVVPIDTRRPIAPAIAGATLASKERPSPHQLLLQPKGSRAWALALMVAGLAIGAWAYSTGAIRTDAEIVSEIVGKFQQDSGLHGKTLTAQSMGHIVTIAGAVDSGIQHTAAVQQASSVRGVRQVVDEVRIAPPAAPKAKTLVPAPASSPTVNASVSLFTSKTATKSAVTSNHVVGPNHMQKTQASSTTSTPQKHKGFFHFFKRNK